MVAFGWLISYDLFIKNECKLARCKPEGKRRKPPGHFGWRPSNLVSKGAATYSPARRSTIGVDGLNFSVRNGKRWNPVAIAT